MTLEGHQGRPIAIDICLECQAFWFDKYESLQLAPASTLRLLKMIGERTSPGPTQFAEATCPSLLGAAPPDPGHAAQHTFQLLPVRERPRADSSDSSNSSVKRTSSVRLAGSNWTNSGSRSRS